MNFGRIANRERLRLGAVVCALLIFVQPILIEIHKVSEHACGHAPGEADVSFEVDLGHTHGSDDPSYHAVDASVAEAGATSDDEDTPLDHRLHCVLCDAVARTGVQCDPCISLPVLVVVEAVSEAPKASGPLAAAAVPFSPRGPPLS